MEPRDRKLAALAVLGTVGLFSPVVGAFSRELTVFGVPLLPAYLFGVWAALVGAGWFVSRRGGP